MDKVVVDDFSGGICVLWDEDKFSLKLLYVHKFFLHVEVSSASPKLQLMGDDDNLCKRQATYPKSAMGDAQQNQRKETLGTLGGFQLCVSGR